MSRSDSGFTPDYSSVNDTGSASTFGTDLTLSSGFAAPVVVIDDDVGDHHTPQFVESSSEGDRSRASRRESGRRRLGARSLSTSRRDQPVARTRHPPGVSSGYTGADASPMRVDGPPTTVLGGISSGLTGAGTTDTPGRPLVATTTSAGEDFSRMLQDSAASSSINTSRVHSAAVLGSPERSLNSAVLGLPERSFNTPPQSAPVAPEMVTVSLDSIKEHAFQVRNVFGQQQSEVYEARAQAASSSQALDQTNWEANVAWYNVNEQRMHSEEQAKFHEEHSEHLAEHLYNVQHMAHSELNAAKGVVQETRDKAHAALQHSQNVADQRVAEASSNYSVEMRAVQSELQSVVASLGESQRSAVSKVESIAEQRHKIVLSEHLERSLQVHETNKAEAQSYIAETEAKASALAQVNFEKDNRSRVDQEQLRHDIQVLDKRVLTLKKDLEFNSEQGLALQTRYEIEKSSYSEYDLKLTKAIEQMEEFKRLANDFVKKTVSEHQVVMDRFYEENFQLKQSIKDLESRVQCGPLVAPHPYAPDISSGMPMPSFVSSTFKAGGSSGFTGAVAAMAGDSSGSTGAVAASAGPPGAGVGPMMFDISGRGGSSGFTGAASSGPEAEHHASFERPRRKPKHKRDRSSSSSSSSSSSDSPDDSSDSSDDDSGNSSSSSSTSEKRRRKKKGKKEKKSKKDKRGRSRDRVGGSQNTKESATVAIPLFPSIAQLPQWKIAFYTNVCAAAGRVDDGKVLKWISSVESTGSTREGFADSGKYSTLDRKISAAFGKIVTGGLARRINLLERREMQEHQRLVSGRERYWMFLDHFKTNANLGGLHSMLDMARVKWMGDKHIETFQMSWNDMLLNIGGDPPENLLIEALLEQMDQSIELKDEVKAFRRLGVMDEKHTYEKLMSIMDQHLLLELQKKNRAASLQSYSLKPGQAAPGPGTNICRKFLQGNCKNTAK